jgi:hypothetical protein
VVAGDRCDAADVELGLPVAEWLPPAQLPGQLGQERIPRQRRVRLGSRVLMAVPRLPRAQVNVGPPQRRGQLRPLAKPAVEPLLLVGLPGVAASRRRLVQPGADAGGVLGGGFGPCLDRRRCWKSAREVGPHN